MTRDVIYCFDRASVLFAIYPKGSGGPQILAEISDDALRDIFGAQGGGDSLVEACRDHLDLIEEVALRHHQHDLKKPVMLEISDFAFASSFATDSAN